MPKKKSRKPPASRKVRISVDELRELVRAAAQDGLTGAIEHNHNFWRTGDGFKRYIDHQIKEREEALTATVRTTLTKAFLEAAWRPPTKRKRKRDRRDRRQT